MIRWAFLHQVGCARTSPHFRMYPLEHGVAWSYLRNNITRVSADTYLFARRLGDTLDLDAADTIWPGDTLVLRRHCTVPRKYVNMPPVRVEKAPLKLPVVRIEPPPPVCKPTLRRSARIAEQQKKNRSKAGK